MKGKFTSVILAVVLVVITVGTVFFGYSKASGKITKSGAEEEQRYAWQLATCSTEDTITHIFATQFAKEVEKLSDGKMKINVYPQSTLGGDRELMESCKDGDIPFVVQSPAPQVSFMPQLCVFDTPCLFENIDDARKAIDNPDFQKEIQKIYKGAGYDLLGIADQCFRVMTSAKPFTGIESFKGQKIRTMENSYHLAFWKAIGANPTPMTFSEVYIGLQQHTIDAQENPYEVIVSNRLYEQQDYVVETNHLPHLISLIVHDDFFQNLTPEEQKIMTQAAKTATEYAREQSDARIFDRIATIEASGTAILTLSDETRDAIREAAGSVYESIRENIDPEIYDAYMEP